MNPNDKNVVLENVRIIFRNFAGKEGRYNREGDRNFSVLLDDMTARAMQKDGWNVKWLKARNEDEDPQAIISVSVSYKGRPPRVVMITGRGRTPLDEDTLEILDWADIRNVDLIVRPYEWVVNGKSGIKAYLQSIFVTIEEDALERKYADLDNIPARAGRTEMEPPF
jgi:hypothetical protein